MNDQHQTIREQLLAQNEPTREQHTKNEKEKQAMFNQLEVGLSREKWGTSLLWIYATLFTTAALLITGYRNPNRPEVMILAFAFTLLIVGAAELIKHFINRSRVEVLKELKNLEVQMLELRAQLSQRGESSHNDGDRTSH